MERRFAEEINSPRFTPFLTLYELEALVFSSPKAVAEHFGVPRLRSALQSVVDAAKSPELIDGSESTHPKERMKRLLEGYDRGYRPVLDGAVILQKIGIPTIRAACQHFAGWISRLEALGRAAQ
jgi:hypothetical protein